MYGIDKPGGPSRRRMDIGQAEIREEGGASASRRVGTSSTSSTGSNARPTDTARTWGQTMYDVGSYGSALGVAYRLLRSPTDTQIPNTSTDTGQAINRKKDKVQGEEGKRGPISPVLDEELEAALGEALGSSISTSEPATKSTEPPRPPPDPPETPIRPLPLAHWSVNADPTFRRRRNDPSRLSRVSYISTMSTQSSTFSSIDSEWSYDPTRNGHGDGDGDDLSMDTPESLYLLTPPFAQYAALPPDGVSVRKYVAPQTPSRIVGLGLSLGVEEGDEEMDEEEMKTMNKLDELLAKVQKLTDDGMRALEMGSTRIHASLPVNMTASSARRKFHTSLD